MVASEAFLSCAQDKQSNEIKHISSVLHGVDLQTKNLLPVCFLSFFHYAKYTVLHLAWHRIVYKLKYWTAAGPSSLF